MRVLTINELITLRARFYTRFAEEASSYRRSYPRASRSPRQRVRRRSEEYGETA